MIVQLVNIGGGMLLGSEYIKEKFHGENVDKLFNTLHPFEARIGVGVALLGSLALIERIGLLHFSLPLGSSFPQAIPAIMTGLLLGAPILSRYHFLKYLIDQLVPHRTVIALLSIACGLGSLLFGCILPVVCGAPF